MYLARKERAVSQRQVQTVSRVQWTASGERSFKNGRPPCHNKAASHINPSMSSSRTTEETYEAQNDQRLDELHSKIRTLRGV